MSNDLTAPNNNGALSTLFSDADDDFAGMRKRDLILPRVAIAQPTTPDVVEGRMQSGAVYDKSTRNVVVKPKEEGLFAVPFLFWLEWIEWNRDRSCAKEDLIVERSVDPTSKLCKRAESWETYVDNDGNERPVVTEFYNFICAIINPKYNNYDDAYLIGFARSSHKIGKMWMNRMLRTRLEVDGKYVRPNMWAMRWPLTTTLVTKDNNRYYVPVIGDGMENPREHWPRLKSIADEFKQRKAEIMDRNTNAADDAEGTTDAPAASASSVAAEM